MIGAGAMARAHSYGYRAAPLIWALPAEPRLIVLCSRDRAKAEQVAGVLGFGDVTTDWLAAVQRPDVDIVDICTPPGLHADVIAAAAAAGKAVICEKPLAATLADAERAAAAASSAGVLSAIAFNYRRLPAVALMHRMIKNGAVGRPRLLRCSWLSDEFGDPGTSFDWRFERETGGSTVADIGSHLIDLAEWMVGPVTQACAQAATYTPVRADGDQLRGTDVEDSVSALLRFGDGVLGTLECSKVCLGRPCDFTIEVNGTDGTIAFDYARLNELRFGSFAPDRSLYGLRTIRAEEPVHPYASRWWSPGQGVGYGASFVNQAGELLSAWPDGPWAPDLETGLRVQRVCSAIEDSARRGQWCQVAEQAQQPAREQARFP